METFFQKPKIIKPQSKMVIPQSHLLPEVANLEAIHPNMGEEEQCNQYIQHPDRMFHKTHFYVPIIVLSKNLKHKHRGHRGQPH